MRNRFDQLSERERSEKGGNGMEFLTHKMAMPNKTLNIFALIF